MYLLPWQIFAMGCVCGICISVFIAFIFLIRIAMRGGVRVEHEVIREKEEDDNG